MKLSCPHCGQHFDVDESDLGKEADCTNCGKRFVLQPAAEQPVQTQQPSSPVACPYCGGELAPGVKKCRHCGEWLNGNKKRKILALTITGIVFFTLLASNVWLLLSRSGRSNVQTEQKKQLPSKLKNEPVPILKKTTHQNVTDAPVSSSEKRQTISPTIGVRNFENPAHSATCILYKNDREIMRRETVVGMVVFMRVECSPDDSFYAEMHYKNGYGVVKEITRSYSRKATQSSGNVITLEPR